MLKLYICRSRKMTTEMTTAQEIVFDNGTKTVVEPLQFFMSNKNCNIPDDAIDAIDLLSQEFDIFKESLSWATGYKRLLVQLPTKEHLGQLTTYKNIFYTLILNIDAFMFTNHKPRREFYMYYSLGRSPGDHDLDFCDHGYNCLEIYFDDYIHGPESFMKDMAILLSIITTFERNDDSGMPMCTGGEYKIIRHRNIMKMKLMPNFDLYDELFDTLFNEDFIKLIRVSIKMSK